MRRRRKPRLLGERRISDVLHLHHWSDRNILGIALIGLASGFGQFGAVAALSNVAKEFGQVAHGATIADQAGLSGTTLAIGLAIIRLASFGGLPLTGFADRFGRRRMILTTAGIGLAFTAFAAASPSYWWFVVIFAAGRPLLSSTNALAQVVAAEQTGSDDRAKAMALVVAGYGIGAGIAAILHSLWLNGLGFRGLFALALVPLVGLSFLRRWITEPDRFVITATEKEHPLPVLGAIEPAFRSRLVVVALFTFALAWITGPANSFIFLYAQDIVHQSGGITAAMVVAAGFAGLAGLLIGRWAADRVGRRPTAAVAMIGVALFGVLAYSGTQFALLIGYVCGILAASVLAPGLGALVNELFPTEVRASVAGWCVAAGVVGGVLGLLVFGALADVGNRFASAALVTFVPAIVATGLFWLVPETRGREPEELWDSPSSDA